ncbi:MAG TPA: recombinase RecA [Candidatus Eremiobacteraceae bacterium]|nr:recombinase RecA [Candidatus Eremiobacteraceae bacterium]
MSEDKAKLIEAAIAQIEKDYGKGSIMRLGNRDVLVPVSVIPTGCLSLDVALGVGGFPRGRVIEVYGPESGGKTTLTLQVVAEAQKLGGIAAFIDAEHALDPIYARKLGVDVDNLLVSQPDNGEQALEIAQTLIRSNSVDIIVVDSVAALVPKAELEGDMGDPSMGLQARLMSQALRKLTGIVSKSRTCLIFINQIREKIGVMFGNPETTTGGRALKFYSSIRVDIRRIQAIKDGDRVVGSRTRGKVVKNKVAAPFREAEFDILYGEGISREGDLIDLGVDKGVLEKSGTWISYGGERLGQGRENARLFLKENKDIREKLESALRKKLGIGPANNANAANAANSANGTNGAAATAHGPNGHAAPTSEKPPVKAAAAAASSSDAGKRPSR